MKRSAVRPGSQTGLVLSADESVTSTGAPPLAETTAMALGPWFPLISNCALPCTKAIQRPSDDQAGECTVRPHATAV